MEEKKNLKYHFNKSQMSLDHPDPVRFARGPWHPGSGPTVRPAFLLFRTIITSLFTGALLWSLISNWKAGKWLMFATHWSLFMCTVQAQLGCYIVVKEFLKQTFRKPAAPDENVTPPKQSMPKIYKVYWLTYNMAIPVAFAVTGLYWGVVLPSGEPVQEGPQSFPLNLTVHGLNSVLCLLEIFFGGPPSRLAHAHHTFLFGVSYVLFNVLYWAFGGLGPFKRPYIYKAMDWGGRPGPTIILSIISLLSLVLFHCMSCGLSKLRSNYVKRLYQKTDPSLQLPEISVGKFNTAYIP